MGYSKQEYYQELLMFFKELKSSDVWNTLRDHWKLYQKKHYARDVKEYAQAEGVLARFGVDSESALDLSCGIGVSETLGCILLFALLLRLALDHHSNPGLRRNTP